MQQRTIGTVALPVMRPVVVKQPMATGFASYHQGVGGTIDSAYTLASVAAVGVCAYHGYKRNGSVGWAIGWALLGGFAPVITTAVAFAQGIGKKKGR